MDRAWAVPVAALIVLSGSKGGAKTWSRRETEAFAADGAKEATQSPYTSELEQKISGQDEIMAFKSSLDDAYSAADDEATAATDAQEKVQRPRLDLRQVIRAASGL